MPQHSRQGFLVVEYPGSEDKYEGEWVLGKKEGKGRYTSATGDVYEGEFREGKRHGVGMYRYSNGDVYEGQWMKGKKHGEGTMTFINGAKYEGGYKEDKRHNLGTYMHADGSVYTGEYKRGKPNGRGIYTFPTGEKFEGEFMGGYKHGIASCTLADGLQYTAKYHLGKRISRKRVSNLPWGYAQDDDDPLANITPVAGSVSSQDKKIAKGHKDMFAFIDKHRAKKAQAAHGAQGSDYDSEDGSVKMEGKGVAKGDPARGSRDSPDIGLDFLSGEPGKQAVGKAASRKGLEGLEDVTKLPDYSKDFSYQVVRTKRIGSATSHLVRHHDELDVDDDDGLDFDEMEEERETDQNKFAMLLFNAMDIDGSGTLSRVEIHLALKRYGFSEAKINALFDVADANQDNVLSRAEFAGGMAPILLAAQGIRMESEVATNSQATHYIDVVINECRNLPPVDHDFTSEKYDAAKEGACNPFVEVILNRQRQQTRVVRETLNPVFQQTHRIFIPEADLGREIEVRTKDWAMNGDHRTIGIVRVAVQDIIDVGHIDSDWFHLETPTGGGFVGHNDEPSEISLSFHSEVVPIILQVGIRRAENLPPPMQGQSIDSFARVVVAGQVQDTRVVASTLSPVFNDQFSFNIFSEDLVKQMVLTVRSVKGAKANAQFIGQCRFNLLTLLEQRSSKDGWCTLMDKNQMPIFANGVDGTQGYARIWVTVSCNLRDDDKAALSELGFSGTATQNQSTGGSATMSATGSTPGTATGSVSHSKAGSSMQSTASGVFSIDSAGPSQSDDTASTEGEFAEDDLPAEPAAGSLAYKQWQTRETHASASASASGSASASRSPSASASGSSYVSGSSIQRGDPAQRKGEGGGGASAQAPPLEEEDEEDDFLRSIGASSASQSVSSKVSSGSAISKGARAGISSGAKHRRDYPPANQAEAVEPPPPPPKEMSRSEQIEVSKLQKKAQKAQDKGDALLAEQYRKDIARIQGVPFRPQAPRTQAVPQASDGATGLASQTSQTSHASSKAGSSSAQSYASGASERSESQSQLSFSIQSGSASLASVPELAEPQGGSSGGRQDSDGGVHPGQAAGRIKKGLFSKLKR